MEKEEILRMSREQKEDEGTVYADNKGRRFGVAGFCSVFVIIMIFNLLTKQNNFVPYSLFFAYMAAEAYGKHQVTKATALMVTTVLASIASAAFLACHVLVVLGIGA